jgi:outer membrane biosynthesis protein TonB
MSKNPPLRSFWRNVTLIALAHVALIVGLIRWSLAARSEPDAESLVWLSGVEDLAAEKSESSAPRPAKISVPSVESEPLRPDEEGPQQSQLTQAKSEIELPTATPAPKPTAKPKTTPKPTPKPTPKKTVLAKAIKSSVHEKSSPPKSTRDQSDASNEKKKSAKTASAKNASSSQNASGKTRSGGLQSAVASGGSNPSEYAWYGNMLHDRFYSAWIQPTTNVPAGAKISTLVKVRIEKDGRVSKFEIIKPSQNVVVNESVAVAAKQVTQVDPPPTGLIHGDHYDVKINFELNTDQQTGNQ